MYGYKKNLNILLKFLNESDLIASLLSSRIL